MSETYCRCMVAGRIRGIRVVQHELCDMCARVQCTVLEGERMVQHSETKPGEEVAYSWLVLDANSAEPCSVLLLGIAPSITINSIEGMCCLCAKARRCRLV